MLNVLKLSRKLPKHEVPDLLRLQNNYSKVAGLDFLGLIPPNFEHLLRLHE